MLKYNLQRLFRMKGIRYPMAFLTKSGIKQSAAYRLTGNDIATISTPDLEVLCRSLKCTPNDLFEWTPGSQSEDRPDNPLFILKRSESKFDISGLVHDMPVDKLEQLQEEIRNAVEKVKRG